MPSIISLKSRKKNNVADVRRWQQIIGAEADGDFGSTTHEITVDWQKNRKLVPDGVVGKNSWEAAGIKVDFPVQVTPKAKANDLKAYEIARRAAPDMPEKHRQYVLTVARGEGRYGLGWETPSATTIKKANEYGLTGYEGTGSNNWGAVQGNGSAGSFMTVDYSADGTPYTHNYKKYTTPEEGFSDMARIILGGGPIRKAVGAKELKDAIDKSDLKGAVYAQHRNKYFELAPEKYYALVKGNYDSLTQSIGWESLLIKQGLSLISIVLGVTTSLLVGIFAYGRFKK